MNIAEAYVGYLNEGDFYLNNSINIFEFKSLSPNDQRLIEAFINEVAIKANVSKLISNKKKNYLKFDIIQVS